MPTTREPYDFQSDYDIIKKLKIIDFDFSPGSGAYCFYELAEKECHFVESPVTMAELLKEQSFIEQWHKDNNEIIVEWDQEVNDVDVPVYETIENFMNGFGQWDWINFISRYEYQKIYTQKVFGAWDESYNKHKIA